MIQRRRHAWHKTDPTSESDPATPAHPSPKRKGAQAAPPPSEREAPASAPSEPEAPARDKATPGGKALLLAAMSNDLVAKGIRAGDLVKAIAPIIKGGGGGPPTMAQAGGKAPENIDDALEQGRAWIEGRLESQ